jgi:thioredoxin-related protein
MKVLKLLTLAMSVFTLVAAAGAARADEAKPLALGAKAPLTDAKFKSATDGKEVSFAQASAGKKGSLVVFTCNECPYAKAWEQRIVELGNSYAKKGVGVLLVNSNNPAASKGKDAPELVQARAKERGMQFAYALDPQSALAKAYGATKTPEAFVFDKDGKLVYHGTIDDNHEDAAAVKKRYLKDALDAVVAGKTPATQETKSLGCGIKFAKVS